MDLRQIKIEIVDDDGDPYQKSEIIFADKVKREDHEATLNVSNKSEPAFAVDEVKIEDTEKPFENKFDSIFSVLEVKLEDSEALSDFKDRTEQVLAGNKVNIENNEEVSEIQNKSEHIFVSDKVKNESVQPKECENEDFECSERSKFTAANHSSEERNIVCRICLKVLFNRSTLRRHLEVVHSLTMAMCEICKKTFKSPIYLQNHIRVAHAPPTAARTCDICKKTFKCSRYLSNHVRKVHFMGGDIACDFCDKL